MNNPVVNSTRQQRSTEQRRAIIDALADAARPLRPEEVLDFAQLVVPGLGIATVYRNLRTMYEKGEIRAVDLAGDASRRYELAGLAHHHHFHCCHCDRLFDIDVCPGDLSHHAPPGFAVTSHDLVLHGSCARCNDFESP